MTRLLPLALAEKIGQMTQVEKNSISPADVTAYFVGSVLSGGDGQSKPNTPEAWYDMIEACQNAAVAMPLKIPLLYGVDAVHGIAALRGATSGAMSIMLSLSSVNGVKMHGNKALVTGLLKGELGSRASW